MTGYYALLRRNLMTDPALRAGLAYGLASSVTEAAAYGLLLASVQWMAIAHDSVGLAITLLLALAGIFGLQSLFRAQGLVKDFTGTYRTMAQIRLDLLDHLVRLPALRQLPDQRAKLLELMTTRFSAVQDIFTHLWGMVIPGMALPLLLLVLVAYVSGLAALILLLSLPVVVGMMLFAFRLLDKADAGLASAQETYAEASLTLLEGAHEIRFLDPHGQIYTRAQTATHQLKAAQMALEVAPAPAIIGYALAAQTGMALAVLVIVLGFQKQDISAGSAFAALILAYRFSRCITDLAGQIAGLRFARNTLQRISQIMARPTVEDPIHASKPDDFEIRFSNVSATFDAEHPMHGGLADINATIRQGRKIALVGVSGSGKTTLAHLALRLQDVGAGAVTIGGINLRDMHHDTLSNIMTLVPQDVHLFEGTLADNIRLGRPDATDAEVLSALKQAQAHVFTQRLPNGLMTDIQVASSTLSGGEKQRLAIARALLMNTPIVVMDEATSQLDTHSEAAIRNTLHHIGPDRTLLTIAHRLWIAQDADEIWVMDNGRIIERGPHDTLMASASTYARLWHAQQQPRCWTTPDAPLN